MKLDIHGHEQRYKNWKERVQEEGEENLTKKNSDILIQFILDMEIGANVSKSNKKGGRSYVRLNSLRQRLSQIIRMLEERNVNDIARVSEKNSSRAIFAGRKRLPSSSPGHCWSSQHYDPN